jgi:EAL domain-containing protein (putative c-di-GMP-specific phosphodiesterase class I)
VVDEVCSFLASLGPARTDLSISINISPVQFHYQNLEHLIQGACERYNLNPTRLMIEITERTTIENAELAGKVLSSLKHLGLDLALDDFGTGYSSLSTLHELEIDWIKIDRRFVQDIDTNKNSYQIVNALMRMAQALDIKVIAEGVETDQEHATLRSLGVTRMQGYFHARPLSGTSLLEFLERS